MNTIGVGGERTAQLPVTWGWFMSRDHHPRCSDHTGWASLREEGRVEDCRDTEGEMKHVDLRAGAEVAWTVTCWITLTTGERFTIITYFTGL